MTAQAFTVFARYDGDPTTLGWINTESRKDCTTLHALINRLVTGAGKPVAWVAASVSMSDRKGAEAALIESIAAGRVIEFRDGKYIPLGVAEEAPKTEEAKNVVARQMLDSVLIAPPFSVRVGATEKKREPLTWATPKPFDAFKGFFTEPADIADWQDTYFPR